MKKEKEQTEMPDMPKFKAGDTAWFDWNDSSGVGTCFIKCKIEHVCAVHGATAIVSCKPNTAKVFEVVEVSKLRKTKKETIDFARKFSPVAVGDLVAFQYEAPRKPWVQRPAGDAVLSIGTVVKTSWLFAHVQTATGLSKVQRSYCVVISRPSQDSC